MNSKQFQSNSDVLVANLSSLDNVIDFTNEHSVQFNVKSLQIINKKSKLRIKLESFINRSVDILAGLCGFFILIPLTIIVYILNRLNGDSGNIFYFQERIGKDGKLFKMPKYRSMIKNADEALDKYLEENPKAKKEYSIYKKLKDDPRITKIRKFLRKTSLDEMPQLLCLLTGEMSLVGPRPYLPREKEDMGVYYKNIVKVKPGITGLWQTQGRSNTTFEERLDFDIKYLNTKSIRNDFKILIDTGLNVLKKDGAI